MSSLRNPVFAVFCAVLLAGCATPVSTNIQASAAHVAKYNDLTALDVVATLEKNVNEAKSANMPFLAPHYFREAAQVLSECQGALNSKPKEVLVSNAAKGDAILEKGRTVMGIVQYRFAKELEYKAQLEEHNAPNLLPKEYEKVIGEFSGLIEKVEREKADNIDKDKEALLKSMLDLVIKAVQEGALRESEMLNADSKKKGADKQAPVTYAEALRVYQEAKSQIAAAHHDQKLVQRLGAEAMFAARHAQQVNDRVTSLQNQLKVVSGGGGVSLSGATGTAAGAQLGAQLGSGSVGAEKSSVEKIVLQDEDRLLVISTALGLKDLRDQALDKQVEEIKRAASGVARQPKSEVAAATAQELEARLKTANETNKQVLTQLAEKDEQLAVKSKQLEAQAASLAEKDEQIRILKEKADRLEWEKPVDHSKAAKPKTVKPKKQ